MLIFKQNDTVYVAELVRRSELSDGVAYVAPENLPIFKARRGNFLVGVTGKIAAPSADTLRYLSFPACREMNEEYVREKLERRSFAALKERKLLDKHDLPSPTFVYAKNDRAFLRCDNVFLELDEEIAFGTNDTDERYLFREYEGLDPETRVRRVYETLAGYKGLAAYPIIFADAKTCRVRILENNKDENRKEKKE